MFLFLTVVLSSISAAEVNKIEAKNAYFLSNVKIEKVTNIRHKETNWYKKVPTKMTKISEKSN